MQHGKTSNKTTTPFSERWILVDFIQQEVLDFPGGGQWLKLHALNTGGPGVYPGWEIFPHMSQIRVLRLQLKIPSATTRRPHVPQLTPGADK